MDLDSFWQLIEQSGREYTDKRIRVKWLEFRLAELPRQEIVDFQIHLDHCRDRIDSAAMWGAAHQICDGLCSGDGFWYFQVWLIGLGREAFEHAAADPDHLADLIEVQRLSAYPVRSWSDEQWPEWEALGYVARKAYGDDSEEQMYSDLEARPPEPCRSASSRRVVGAGRPRRGSPPVSAPCAAVPTDGGTRPGATGGATAPLARARPTVVGLHRVRLTVDRTES